MNKFGDFIRIERLRRRMSQKMLGKKIGVSKTTIGLWENGHKEPGAINLIRLAVELNIEWELLKECFCKETLTESLERIVSCN